MNHWGHSEQTTVLHGKNLAADAFRLIGHVGGLNDGDILFFQGGDESAEGLDA